MPEGPEHSDRTSFEIASTLAAPCAEVWASARSIAGVNRELSPFLRMTCPFPHLTLDAPEVPLGTRAFRSYLLLFGLVPFELDDVTLARVDPGRGFLETSSMLSLKRWRHERELRPGQTSQECVLIDRIAFEPRAPLRPLTPAIKALCSALFRWRHRRLRAAFGEAPRPPR